MAGDLSLVAAFGGGVVSFLSPCVLPLVPAYLSVVTGLGVGDLAEGGRHRVGRVLPPAGGFIAGFSAVFIVLGLTATTVGRAVAHDRVLLSQVSGMVVVAMALFLGGSLVLRAPWLYQEKRWNPALRRFGPLAAPVAGVAFGFGWTPCIGPVLTSVLALAATSTNLARGASLLVAYSAGLAVPLLASAVALDRLAGAFAVVKRHFTALVGASAVLLGVFGVLLAIDRLTLVTVVAERALTAVGLGRLLTLG